jgi:hypothetical protein
MLTQALPGIGTCQTLPGIGTCQASIRLRLTCRAASSGFSKTHPSQDWRVHNNAASKLLQMLPQADAVSHAIARARATLQASVRACDRRVVSIDAHLNRASAFLAHTELHDPDSSTASRSTLHLSLPAPRADKKSALPGIACLRSVVTSIAVSKAEAGMLHPPAMSKAQQTLQRYRGRSRKRSARTLSPSHQRMWHEQHNNGSADYQSRHKPAGLQTSLLQWSHSAHAQPVLVSKRVERAAADTALADTALQFRCAACHTVLNVTCCSSTRYICNASTLNVAHLALLLPSKCCL